MRRKTSYNLEQELLYEKMHPMSRAVKIPANIEVISSVDTENSGRKAVSFPIWKEEHKAEN